MKGKLAAYLRALDRNDLETLLARRPESRELLGRGALRGVAGLATVLSRPDGIWRAIGRLDRFHLQVLQVAAWLGPAVSIEHLRRQTPEASEAALFPAAGELARWGLAFPTRRDSSWPLEVPDPVAAALAEAGGLGPPAATLLAHRSLSYLRAVAGRFTPPPPASLKRRELAAELVRRLSDVVAVQRIVAGAPGPARAMLEEVREAGGGVAWNDLLRQDQVRPPSWHWEPPSPGETSLAWLESRGLLMPQCRGDWLVGAPAVVPAEVELALRGGRIFDDWELEPPAATPSGADQEAVGDPLKVIGDAESLLAEWEERPGESLQRGGLGVREVRKAAKAVRLPERYAGFLYALLSTAGLLGSAGRQVLPTPKAEDWCAEPPPARWAALFDAWRTSMLWSETDDGLLRIDQVKTRPALQEMRSAVLHELNEIPFGKMTAASSVARRLAWRRPLLVHCPECGQLAVERAVEALVWLGAAAGPDPVALGEPARRALADPKWCSRPEAPSAFPPLVDTCTVGADLKIIVPGAPATALASALGRFADLESSSPARIYRLSEASLRRGLDGGMTAEAILATLEEHASKGVPQSVAYMIGDVGRRHGSLAVGEAGLYLRADDPVLLKAAIADGRIARLSPRLIAPTVAVIKPVKAGGVDGLLAQLRSAGYLPVGEDGAGAGSRSRRARPLIGPGRLLQPTALTEAEASRLAETLGRDVEQAPAARRGTSRQGAGAELQSPVRVLRLLEEAAGTGSPVEISYRSHAGERTVRTIEPLEVIGLEVRAWCRLRDQERTFHLTRIGWARLAADGRGADLDRRGEDAEVIYLERG